MLKLILRRLALSVPLVLVVTALTFALENLAPGDLARTILGADGTEAQYEAMRHQLGLDRPLILQYFDWLWRALHGDLGQSFFTKESVVSLVNARIGVTISIMLGVLVVCTVLGLALGVASALKGGALGRAIDFLSLVGLIFPSFWVALVLISVFAVTLHWLPATGYSPLAGGVGPWIASLTLPVVAVALHSIANVAKQARNSMADVLGRDFIRALRACGVPESSIVWKHALRNAALPVVTVLGIVLVGAISGAVFVERVFVLPGLGSLAVSAALDKDIALLQGVTLYFTLITVIINLGIDISYGWLNPKVRLA